MMDDEEAMDEEIERELTEEARNNNNEQKDIEVHQRPGTDISHSLTIVISREVTEE